VPLDPSYPQARLAHMVADSGVSIIVTELALKDEVAHALTGAPTMRWRSTHQILRPCSKPTARSLRA